jgi:hypothetical protein
MYIILKTYYTGYMMNKEKNMVTNLCAGAFELRTGRPTTWGLSRYRDGEAMKIRWEKTGPVSGRWFFEIDGVQYSAKSISPYLKQIQMHS